MRKKKKNEEQPKQDEPIVALQESAATTTEVAQPVDEDKTPQVRPRVRKQTYAVTVFNTSNKLASLYNQQPPAATQEQQVKEEVKQTDQ